MGRITVAQLTARNNHRLLKFQCIHACFKKTMILLYLTVLSSYVFPSKNNLKQISKLVYTHVLFLLTKFLISWAKQNTFTWIIIYSLVLLQSKSQITGPYTSYLKLQDVQTIIVLCSMFSVISLQSWHISLVTFSIQMPWDSIVATRLFCCLVPVFVVWQIMSRNPTILWLIERLVTPLWVQY